VKKRRIIAVFVAMVLAGIGVAALVAYTQSAKNDAVAKEALVDVYVVNKLIPKGSDTAAIKANIVLAKVPARLKQPGAVTSVVDLGTKVAGSDLQPGDQLIQARLVEKVESDVPADKVQITANLSTERAVGGVLKKGDLVGVYLSFDPFDANVTAGINPGGAEPPASTPPTTAAGLQKTPNVTHLEFQHVLVTNVQISDEQTKNVDGKDQTTLTSSTNYLVTLALTPAQSERFVFASEFGHVWLANEPATVNDDGTALTTLGNVYSVVEP
jgi:pilus assembly protein CpaB